MRLVDTHCHVQDRQYNRDREEVIIRARENNVSMICVGTDLEMSRSAIELADKHSDIWASVGLHPNDNLDEKYHNDVYQELAQHPRVIAIGEIGLDYYRTTDPAKKKFQRERFLLQLELARQIQKPVIIHCRNAHEDMISILRGQSDISGVIHSFTGNVGDSEAYVSMGFSIGLNGIVTFARQYDEVVRSLPLEKMLLETDAPYLTPAPYRGKRNEPAFLVHVAQQIAEIRGITAEEAISVTTKNAENLFKLS